MAQVVIIMGSATDRPIAQKAEKILAGEDLDIQAECKIINDHKLDSKEIVIRFDYSLLA